MGTTPDCFLLIGARWRFGLSGNASGLDQQGCCTSSLVSSGMGDRDHSWLDQVRVPHR